MNNLEAVQTLLMETVEYVDDKLRQMNLQGNASFAFSVFIFEIQKGTNPLKLRSMTHSSACIKSQTNWQTPSPQRYSDLLNPVGHP